MSQQLKEWRFFETVYTRWAVDVRRIVLDRCEKKINNNGKTFFSTPIRGLHTKDANKWSQISVASIIILLKREFYGNN